MLRIETKELLPQAIDDGSKSHRRSRMAGISLLHGIHRKSADSVDAQLIDAHFRRFHEPWKLGYTRDRFVFSRFSGRVFFHAARSPSIALVYLPSAEALTHLER